MSKECFICGKSTAAGRNIQHHHSIAWRFKAPKTLRTFEPNLQKVKIELDGKVQTVTVCMKCYKRLRKDAGEK